MSGSVPVRVSKDGLRLDLRVSPGSSRNAVLGVYGDRLKVAVRAAPERGKANRSVVVLLESALALPKGSVEIVSGSASPSKSVAIRGIERDKLLSRIEALIRATGEEKT
jgi:hypothetical protein